MHHSTGKLIAISAAHKELTKDLQTVGPLQNSARILQAQIFLDKFQEEVARILAMPAPYSQDENPIFERNLI